MKLKRIPHVIQIMNEEDQHHFYQSLQEVIQSIIENIDPLFYHDYHFDICKLKGKKPTELSKDPVWEALA